MCFSYMHMLCFIIDLGIDGCIHPPCVSNELDQYLSEQFFCTGLKCKIRGKKLSIAALIVI